jgi:hypothetical protein
MTLSFFVKEAFAPPFRGTKAGKTRLERFERPTACSEDKSSIH